MYRMYYNNRYGCFVMCKTETTNDNNNDNIAGTTQYN